MNYCVRVPGRPAHVCAALLSLCVLAKAQGAFYLHDGDRVVFYGDSITEQSYYTTLVESYALTRFPGLKVAYVNSGVGGDSVSGGAAGTIQKRLERDVIAQKPTVLTIMLGMNDGGYRAFDKALFQAYRSGLEDIVRTVKSSLPNTRMTLLAPSPFDDVTQPPQFPGGYNRVLLQYGQFVREMAQREKLDFADLNTPVINVLEKALRTDPEMARKMIPDRVHPSAAGHLIMAEALLKSWHAPALVTAVTIDASGRRVGHAENTRIGEFRSGGGLHWVQTDGALPLPVDLVDVVMALAVRCSDVVEALDRQTLQITGLAGGRYLLKIDGQQIGTFTDSQLGAGINLAVLMTPMTKQAATVLAFTQKRNNVRAVRWRLVQVALQDDILAHKGGALKSLDILEKELIQRQHESAQSKPHHYDVIPVNPTGGTQ